MWYVCFVYMLHFLFFVWISYIKCASLQWKLYGGPYIMFRARRKSRWKSGKITAHFQKKSQNSRRIHGHHFLVWSNDTLQHVQKRTPLSAWRTPFGYGFACSASLRARYACGFLHCIVFYFYRSTVLFTKLVFTIYDNNRQPQPANTRDVISTCHVTCWFLTWH